MEGGKEEEESYGRSMAKVLTSSREDPLAWVPPSLTGQPHPSSVPWGSWETTAPNYCYHHLVAVVIMMLPLYPTVLSNI